MKNGTEIDWGNVVSGREFIIFATSARVAIVCAVVSGRDFVNIYCCFQVLEYRAAYFSCLSPKFN
jgi:hypothetical protein